jgi:hypothetical protein
METRWLVLLPVALTLWGCSSGQRLAVTQPPYRPLAWDGLGRDPNVPAIKPARTRPRTQKAANDNRETELAGLREYSREWVVLRTAIDAEEDARISKLLVICEGCGTSSDEARQPSHSVSLTRQRNTDPVRESTAREIHGSRGPRP